MSTETPANLARALTQLVEQTTVLAEGLVEKGPLPEPSVRSKSLLNALPWDGVWGRQYDQPSDTAARDAEIRAWLRFLGDTAVDWPSTRVALRRAAVRVAQVRFLEEPEATDEIDVTRLSLFALLAAATATTDAPMQQALSSMLSHGTQSVGDQLIVYALAERTGDHVKAAGLQAAMRVCPLVNALEPERVAALRKHGVVPTWPAGPHIALLQTRRSGLVDGLIARLADPYDDAFVSKALVRWWKALEQPRGEHQPDVTDRVQEIRSRIRTQAMDALGPEEAVARLRILSTPTQEPTDSD